MSWLQNLNKSKLFVEEAKELNSRADVVSYNITKLDKMNVLCSGFSISSTEDATSLDHSIRCLMLWT